MHGQRTMLRAARQPVKSDFLRVYRGRFGQGKGGGSNGRAYAYTLQVPGPGCLVVTESRKEREAKVQVCVASSLFAASAGFTLLFQQRQFSAEGEASTAVFDLA